MTGELRDIRKSYGKRSVLRGVSFAAERGEAIGIVGANGSGKSTLLRVAAGILKPQAGQFLWEGSDLLRSRLALERTVAYVPQGTPLIDELSALDNLRLWYEPSALHASLESGMLRELGVQEFLKTPAGRLSGGDLLAPLREGGRPRFGEDPVAPLLRAALGDRLPGGVEQPLQLVHHGG